MKSLFARYFGLVIVLLLSFFAIQSLTILGSFPIHDDTQVVRVYEMTQSLKDGHFPVRWVKDLGYGYGYPLFNFYGPLPYYIGSLISLSGFDPLVSTKIMMILGVLLSGVFMYLLAQEFWGDIGGIVSGLFYVYAPYHAVDVYVRGAVGEYWAIVFIPLVFYGLWKLHKEKKWKWVIVGALGFAGIVTSHNLTAFMVTPFILLSALLLSFSAYKQKKVGSITYYVFSIVLGLGIAAFYWIPALFEMQFTNVSSQIGGGADFRNHFVCLWQLWDSPWGFGGSAPGCIDGMSFKIGKLHIIGSFVAFFIGLHLFRKDRTRSIVILFASYVLLVSIFMMLDVSKTVWETNPALEFIQYPWRFMTVATFAAAFLTGFVAWYFSTSQYPVALFLVGALLFFNVGLFQPQTILPLTAEHYTTEEYIKWTTSKISDEYMPKNFQKPTEAADVIKERSSKTQEFSIVVNNEKDSTLHIDIAPFPAWKTFIDGSEVDYLEKDDGIEVIVPKGDHEVQAIFVETSTQQLANAISLGSILIAVMVYFRLRYAKTRS